MPEVQEQNSTFYKVLIALAGIIVCNLLFAMLCAVFNFYDFNYSSFYSVFIFYIFIMSCRLVLPVSIPYEKTGMENLELFATVSPGAASSINNLFGILNVSFNFFSLFDVITKSISLLKLFL